MIFYNTHNVTVFQSEIFKMNSTVVNTEDFTLVVDPGYLPNEIKEIRGFVDSIKQDKPLYLFFTHSDFDHIVGYGAFPDAITIASKEFAESNLKNKQVEDIIHFDDDLYIDREYEAKFPLIKLPIKRDGQKLKIGKTEIEFFHAFGHTKDGLFALIKDLNLLIAGDYLSDLEFPFVYHSFEDYENTLALINGFILANNIITLIPGHGSVAVEGEEIKKRIKSSEEYFQLVKNDEGEEDFTKFLVEMGYKYKTNLLKRHQENLMIWKHR